VVGKSAIGDAPAITTVPFSPLRPFVNGVSEESGAGAAGCGAPYTGISGGVASILTMTLTGGKAPEIRRSRIAR
jgi:hypothetical protein